MPVACVVTLQPRQGLVLRMVVCQNLPLGERIAAIDRRYVGDRLLRSREHLGNLSRACLDAYISQRQAISIFLAVKLVLNHSDPTVLNEVPQFVVLSLD